MPTPRVDKIREAGPSILKNHDLFIKELTAGGPLTAMELATVLSFTTNEHSWSGMSLGACLRTAFPRENWPLVVSHLDKLPDFTVRSPQDLANMFVALQAIAPDSTLIHTFLTIRWSNTVLRSAILQQIFLLSPEDFNFADTNLLKVVSSYEFPTNDHRFDMEIARFRPEVLNILDVIRFLFDCANERVHNEIAATILDRSVKILPELIFIGALKCPKPWTPLQDRAITSLFDLFFSGHPSEVFVFSIVFNIDESFLLNMFVDLFSRTSTVMPRIVEISQEIDRVEEIARCKSLSFSIEFACVAAGRNALALNTFLLERYELLGETFVNALLVFLDVRSSQDYSDLQSNRDSVTILSLPVVSLCLAFLSSLSLGPEQIEKLQIIQTQCLQTYSRLVNWGQGFDDVILMNSKSNSFSPFIEREMKESYQKLYEQQMTIGDFIIYLQSLKESRDPTDQDVFACMIHSLFDEYRFFPQYPVSALATTAVLFGSLIQYRLIDGIALSVAFRYILDALKESPDSNMYKFSLQALLQFQMRLPEFPEFCSVLAQVLTLDMLQPQLYEKIREIALSYNKMAPSDSSAAVLAPTSIFSCVNVRPDTSGIMDEAETIDDKVLLIVNNVSKSNIDVKVKDLVEILDIRQFRAFSKYLVERVKFEPNNQRLYFQICFAIADPLLDYKILRETYVAILSLMFSESITSSSTERNHLKNLGSWLGMITLGQNRPILHKNVSFKDLLIQGYNSDRLMVVLPFACKALEHTASSKIFKPPNPWTMGILRLLVEFHRYANLKLNLKFEIEVLFKTLKMDINEVDPSTSLRETLAVREQVEATTAASSITKGMDNLSLQQLDQAPLSPSGRHAIVAEPSFSSQALLTARFEISGSSIFAIQPAMKKVFILALDKTVREVLDPVVERSISVACVTSRCLIAKDYALESDEKKLMDVTSRLVQRLASSLSMVTNLEGFHAALEVNIRAILLSSGVPEQSIPADSVSMAVNDNAGTILAIIDAAVKARAVQEVNEVMVPLVSARVQHREKHPDEPFIDPAVSKFALSLPDPLSLSLSSVPNLQSRVYESLGQQPAGPQSVRQGVNTFSPGNVESIVQPYTQSPKPNKFSALLEGAHGDPIISNLPDGVNDELAAVDQMMATVDNVVNEAVAQVSTHLEQLCEFCKTRFSKDISISELPDEGPVKNGVALIINTINDFVSHPAAVELFALKCSETIINMLFTYYDVRIDREMVAFCLDRLCDLSPGVTRDIIRWLVESKDERKYNVPAILTLIEGGFVSPPEFDVLICDQISDENPLAVSFICDLISESVLSTPPIALRTDFTACLQALHEYYMTRPNSAKVSSLFEALSNAKHTLNDAPPGLSKQIIREEMGVVFAEWIRLTQHPAQTSKLLNIFIYQMIEEGVFSNLESLSLFYRVGVEMAVDGFIKVQDSRTGSDEVYIPIDSMAKLIVRSLCVIDSSENSLGVSGYFKVVLAVVTAVFAHRHESMGASFNQKPFFRLFSSMFSEWSALASPSLPNPGIDDTEFYEQVSNTLKTIQPIAFPGFTFAWLSLISHRSFMPIILSFPNCSGFPYMFGLMEAALKFFRRYLVPEAMPNSVKVVYKGFLRIVLLLLHDCPEFLVGYHYELCALVPSECTQLRNMFLCAFPKAMTLPSPFTPDIKMENVAGISKSPFILGDYVSILSITKTKECVDDIVLNRDVTPGKISPLLESLRIPQHDEPGLGFNSISTNPLAVNALMVYLGVLATSDFRSTYANDDRSKLNVHGIHYLIISKVIEYSGWEESYFLLSAMVNQLRYPNSHTQYFSAVLLSLFNGTWHGHKKQEVQEQITRVLLERVICSRPHPWGVLVTFTELLKNPVYQFWDLGFIRSSTEVEKLFGTLYNHISVPAA
ncbi:hypothetical protein CANCADRAFT_717 [Tortispora caseinolytica NRRL Y-17796]|uniref:Uncharacterized protein n=1 Tax=Tortispora caseinolytica NRRL Y-17796 TaxID=767744 RepID=A0A1E4TK62_9ASCO|nr:hypothetical protein CANCADRAFT_717 [Tortispora caseinolytica NRRL Y-17796]